MSDPIEAFYATPTWGRKPNLDLCMDHLARRFPGGGGFLIEVGGMRAPGNVHGDGCASVAWATHAVRYGETFVSVDTDPVAVEHTARLVRSGLDVLAVRGDGADVLRGIHGPIHLLYLDGSNDPAETLAQFRVAASRVAVGGLVVVDDQDVKAPALLEAMGREPGYCDFPLEPGVNQRAWERVA